MPPSVTQNTNTHRRSTGSIRQRENRVHPNQHTHTQGGPGSARRRKSRSPDSRIPVDEGPAQNDLARRKKRLPPIPGSASPSLHASSSASRLTYNEDSGDRGRTKAKLPKSKTLSMMVDDDEDDTQIVTNIVTDYMRSNNAQNGKSKRKDRSRSRETTHRHSRKTATPEPAEEGDEPMYTGPLAHAEYTRMRQEMEQLRKQLAMAKKTITKQSKVIDGLRAEISTTNEAHRTQRAEIEKLKTESKKSDGIVATFESSLSCQVCMELLLKPYGLAPCGHILCVSCLLSWFKSAPPGEDDMYDDDNPQALMFRKKTCPCCRAVISSRPIPLYLVKSLASTLEKSKPAGTSRPSPPPDTEDPWAGIFRDNRDYYSSSDEDGDEDDDEGEGYDDEDYWSVDGYGSDEDDQYEGAYVNPHWEPPTIYVAPEEHPFLDEERLSMLRRGATLPMIELFQMTYEHDTGLCAVVDGENTVYLGWNIELHPDDQTGEEYIDYVLSDMYARPERWRIHNDHIDGTWSAWQLIPEDEVDDYDNTDSEIWAEELGEEDDDEEDDY